MKLKLEKISPTGNVLEKKEFDFDIKESSKSFKDLYTLSIGEYIYRLDKSGCITSIIYDPNPAPSLKSLLEEDEHEHSKEWKKVFIDEEVENEEYLNKLKTLKKDEWKRCLTEELSYSEEYLLIMQYERVQTKNAEDARAAGKGTFGYRFRGVTEDEFNKMEEIYLKNFDRYLVIKGRDNTLDYEWPEMDDEGGWNYEEMETK